MRHLKLLAISVLVAIVILANCSRIPTTIPDTTTSPFYFIAIHNEPTNVESAYFILKEMIEKADEYHIKLTLMFTAQWADYISESPQRMADLEEWKRRGHEIAAHHHGIYHGAWDGYTFLSEEEAVAIRAEQGKHEAYLGTLIDYVNRLKNINFNIESGCLNEESDKRELPDEIICATCSGFANHGEPGRREGDTIPEKGKNEYITVGTCNNIQRKWLAHYQIYQNITAAENIFNSMDHGQVFGGVVHSNIQNAESYYLFLEFLHSKDPQGIKSKTVSKIIEQELIPEKTIPDYLLKPSK